MPKKVSPPAAADPKADAKKVVAEVNAPHDAQAPARKQAAADKAKPVADSPAPAKKAAPAAKAPAKAPVAAKSAEAPAKAAVPAKAPATKAAATKAPPTKAPATKAVPAAKATKAAAPARPAAPAKPKGERAAFFASQRVLLEAERDSYVRSAEALKAQADSLALEHEPGDVQFDEEGGEGGTATVDREMDLYLSAQARSTILEIDRALEKIVDGSYGICEQCHQPIPDARLEALPYASMCVSCKSGGLSSRR